MSKEGGGAVKATKSETNSDDKKWKEMLEKTQESENSKKEEPAKGSKEEIQQKSNGLNDKLCLPDDYSERVRKERKTGADEKTPLLAPSTVPSNPTGPQKLDKQKSKKSGCCCYSSEIEDYRIPSIVIIIVLAIETCAYCLLSTWAFHQPINFVVPASYAAAAGLTTLLILAFELLRFIFTYCVKSITTANEWKWHVCIRISLIVVHLGPLLFTLTTLVYVIFYQDPDKNMAERTFLIAVLPVFLVLSALHIVILAWPKKK